MMDTVSSNSITFKIINRSESENARKIEATYQNKWKWSWLEENQHATRTFSGHGSFCGIRAKNNKK